MYDGGKIVTGLVLFVGVALFPVWRSALGEKTAPPQPKIVTQEKQCVASKDVIRATHMELLNQWREAVVRDGVRSTVTATGLHVDMSLTRTCLSCHSNKTEFCDSCHNYVAVSPYCWDCHVAPEEKERT